MAVSYPVVKQAVDEWDPLDLLTFRPEDAYDEESLRLAAAIDAWMRPATVARLIQDLFVHAFGPTVFTQSLEACVVVADRILRDAADAATDS